MLTSRRVGLLILSVFGAACAEEPKPERLPPPPVSSATASACASGGGQSDDPTSAAFFPRVSGAFCLDPNSGAKTFGEGGKKPLDRICDLFDGECELYLRLGVSRVVELRYVSGTGSPATVDVYLSRFASSEAAYAMFTTRVVGDGDPADEATPTPTPGGGAAALGLGNGYVWRGPYLLEVTYNDETASEKTLRGAADAVLPKLLEEIGGKLPGDTALPAAVRLLPSEARLPSGVRFVADKAFGLTGVSGAFGYYRAGAQRFRVAALVRADEDQAKDTLATLGKLAGASTEKDGTVRVMVTEEGGAKAEWLFARRKQEVLGVGDEVRVQRAGMPADEAATLNLPKADKAARLAKLLAN